MVVDVSSQYYPAHPVGKLRSLLFMVISDRLRARPLDSGPTILLQHPPVKSRRITAAKNPSSFGWPAHANSSFPDQVTEEVATLAAAPYPGSAAREARATSSAVPAAAQPLLGARKILEKSDAIPHSRSFDGLRLSGADPDFVSETPSTSSILMLPSPLDVTDCHSLTPKPAAADPADPATTIEEDSSPLRWKRENAVTFRVISSVPIPARDEMSAAAASDVPEQEAEQSAVKDDAPLDSNTISAPSRSSSSSPQEEPPHSLPRHSPQPLQASPPTPPSPSSPSSPLISLPSATPADDVVVLPLAECTGGKLRHITGGGKLRHRVLEAASKGAPSHRKETTPPRFCTFCAIPISGPVYMLYDQPYCTAECRLNSCRQSQSGAGSSVTAGGSIFVSRSHSAVSVDSCTSMSSASTTGLMASYKPWL